MLWLVTRLEIEPRCSVDQKVNDQPGMFLISPAMFFGQMFKSRSVRLIHLSEAPLNISSFDNIQSRSTLLTHKSFWRNSLSWWEGFGAGASWAWLQSAWSLDWSCYSHSNFFWDSPLPSINYVKVRRGLPKEHNFVILDEFSTGAVVLFGQKKCSRSVCSGIIVIVV